MVGAGAFFQIPRHVPGLLPGPLLKKCGGGRGDPPPLLSLQGGVTPLPMCPGRWGVSPPPSGPVRPTTTNQKTTASKSPPSKSPREQPCISRAETAGIPDSVRGGTPPPPSPFVRSGGGHPPPIWLSGWGVGPLGNWRGGSGSTSKYPD